MADDKTIKVIIEAILKDDQFKSSLKTMTAEAKKASKENQGFFNGIKDSYLGIAAGIGAVVGALAGVIHVVKESMQAWRESQKASQMLATAFARTGQDAEKASKDFEKFAEALSQVTVYSDTEITKNAALVQSLTGLSEKGLEQATQAAVDLASGLQMDLGKAFDLVENAVNGNMNSLKRYGVYVKEGMSRTENLANVVGVLGKQFKGVAEVEGRTLEGQMRRLENAIDKVKEKIGRGIYKALGSEDEGTFKETLATFEEIGEVASQVAFKVVNFVKNMFLSTYHGIKAIFVGMSEVGTQFSLIFNKNISLQTKINVLKAIERTQQAKARAEIELSDKYEKMAFEARLDRAEKTSEKTKKLGKGEIGESKNIADFKIKMETMVSEFTQNEVGKTQDELKRKYDELLKYYEGNKDKEWEIVSAYLEKTIALDREYYLKYGKSAEELTKLSAEELAKRGEDHARYLEEHKKLEDTSAADNIERLFNYGDTYRETEAQIAEARATGNEAVAIALEENVKDAKKAAKDIETAYSGLNNIIGQIAGAIGGEMGEAIKGTMQFADALIQAAAKGDIMGAVMATVAAAVGAIINEIGKAQKYLEDWNTLQIAEMERVDLFAADLAVRRAERDKATAMERFNIESDNYANLSAEAQAYSDFLKAKDAEAYAAMDEKQKKEFDLKKQYEDAKRAEEEKQDALIKEAKMRQFEMQKEIDIAKANIDWDKAEAEIRKNYPMPWDASLRDSLVNENANMYRRIIDLMSGMVPAFASGTPMIGSDTLANVHKGERIIPAALNPRGISNTDLIASAMRGIGVGQAGAGSTYNQQKTMTSTNVSMAGANFNLSGIQNPKDFMRWMNDYANGMGANLLGA